MIRRAAGRHQHELGVSLADGRRDVGDGALVGDEDAPDDLGLLADLVAQAHAISGRGATAISSDHRQPFSAPPRPRTNWR